MCVTLLCIGISAKPKILKLSWKTNCLINDADIAYLRQTLVLADRHQGCTGENPSVGCVLVKDAAVIAQAATAIGGRPHAETIALAQAGEEAARGATAYVSLEPCAHTGQTPPCTDALITAGITRVVIAASDPDPRVNGGGMAALQAAGIAVALHPLAEAQLLYRGFFRRVRRGFPEVALKVACSADYQMIRHSEKWITQEAARMDGQRLRARHQAILTGIGTVLDDDPALTCRLDGMEDCSPIRIVLDRKLRMPLRSQMVQTAEKVPVWLLTHHEAMEQNASHATELREAGVIMHVLDDPALPIIDVLAYLGAQGIHRLMVEAGPVLSQVFLDQGFADWLYLYQSPDRLGADGGGLIRLPLSHHIVSRCSLAPDSVTLYRLTSCLPD
jgi:diaminohydroxyphosphoribosylaminopyrimidine deaminase/5-amino-6-(5-phosphoribosylamino)uracil reductase